MREMEIGRKKVRKKFEIPKEGLIRLGAFLLAGYFIVNLSRSLYRNKQYDAQIGDVESSITEIEKQNEELRSLAEFYRTKAYKERQAREKLNLKLPDENVLIIPRDPEIERKQTEGESSSGESGGEQIEEQNAVKWWRFFFG